MAERRMFAKTIVLSDAFLDLPMSARCLYFTLGMLADDDGFVNAPRSIMRQCGASDDDMKILISKKFVLIFESGVIVIKHWRLNNYLRSDRYQETKYTDEKATLSVDESGIYHRYTNGIPPGIPSNGIPSIGKDRLGKDSIGQDRIEEGDNKGEPDSFIPDQNTIDHWGNVIEKTISHGWDPEGQYKLAALKGVSRDLIQAYLDKKKEAAS